MLQMIIRRLIPAMPGFTIVSVNPGLCATRLARRRQFQWDYANVSQLIWNKLVSRTSEQGARNVTTAAILAKDSHEVSRLHRFPNGFELRADGASVLDGL